MSNNPEQNPDFYNWNKVMIRYCDGSSFTDNSQKKQNGTKLYFRGAKIYKSTINEMKKRGLKSAKKALLVGESAGGVATTIHCDRFRDLFSSSAHVKCLSDAGFFFPARLFVYLICKLYIIQSVFVEQKSTKMLPKSCTSQLNPAMCFFAQNVQQYIKTPIFFIMSEFDYFEIGFTVGRMNPYTTCVKYKNCTSDQITIMQGRFNFFP
nr:pectin acetylesterase 8-like [Ipomoea batatas]